MLRAHFYYMQGLGSIGDVILKEVTDSAIRGYHRSVNDADTLNQKTEEDMMQRTLQMMQQFNPKLLEQYGAGGQSSSPN